MAEYRLEPDELLKVVQEDEDRQGLGELKIFFGMAAGVGKTYAMLEDAHQCLKEGKDVWIGVVDTHGLAETEKLMEGIPRFPEKWVNYKDVAFSELDIDAILERRPQVVIVDELAHTNVPGSRHPKRWQDVIELLDAGISVYTAMNVQHLESRKDLVESITGVSIRETVPDLILERATTIELVDIPPSKLLQRLKEGKIYLGDQPQIAVDNFFKEDNLTALREIALRFTAEKVDHDLHDMLIAGKGWRTREKLMAAINSSRSSEQLIRSARRLAFELHAPWIAVYVNTGNPLSKEEEAALNTHFNLARTLGAEVITTHDVDIASALTRIAKQKNITRIVIGRTEHKSIFSSEYKRFIERLEAENKGVDIVLLRESKDTKRSSSKIAVHFHSSRWSYCLAALSVLLVSGLGTFILPFVGYKAVGLAFLLVILLLGFFVGQGPILSAAFLSTFAWEWFFVPSTLSHADDVALVGLYFITAVIVGLLSTRIHQQRYVLQRREENVEHLYEVVTTVSKSSNIEELRLNTSSLLKSFFGGEFDILTRGPQGDLVFDGYLSIWTQDIERSAALWTFTHGKVSGWSTDTLNTAKAFYLPIKYGNNIVGLIACVPDESKPLGPDQTSFLQNVADQLGVYLHRYIFELEAKSEDYTRQVEKLQQAIFRSLTRGFYIPIEGILDLNEQIRLINKDPKIAPLLTSMENTSKNLKVIVENVLTMAILESGTVPFDKRSHSIRELVNLSLEAVESFLEGRKIDVFIPEQDLYFSFDLNLMKIALANVLLNAIEYSPRDQPILLEASIRSGGLRIAVLDRGPGIPSKVIPFIFDKFYRIPTSQWQGMSLGLTIVKAVMELHQGKIEIKDREGGGTEFALVLGES